LLGTGKQLSNKELTLPHAHRHEDLLAVAGNQRGQRVITTVYEDHDSYVPLARIEHSQGQEQIKPKNIYYYRVLGSKHVLNAC
jgi:hypothetical protein